MNELKEMIQPWTDYFNDIGMRRDIIAKYEKYIERMIFTGYPVIFEFNHLAQLLGRTNGYLASVVNSPESHYRSFKIPKRRGGYREISAPYPALLQCQRWINDNILSKKKIHRYAHGFVSNKSIITNARQHLNKKCLLKIDLKDFFPTIKINQVIKIFIECGYPPNVAFYLARVCCCNNQLPQGAATSPALSNIISYGLDSRLSGIAKRFGLKYTRYADDITLSGDKITIKTLEIINTIIMDQGFMINMEKSHLCRSQGKRIVTGLSVSTDSLLIPRQYKRELRQEVYYILKYGLYSHVNKRKIKKPFFLDSIIGKLVFWHTIEPQNSYANQALNNVRRLGQSI